ncbi:hypothetical protein KH5_19900 [Urechidicola sp. KH5]
MKKFLVTAVIAVFGISAFAQNGNFNAGINFGFPTGDASDFSSFNLKVEVNYLFEVSEAFDVGPSMSYSHYFGKEIGSTGINWDDVSFLPLAAAARFNASDKFAVGGDIGYAIGLSPSGNDGGFYYRPLVGYNVTDNIMIQASYSGISRDGGTFSNFGIGGMYSF